MILPTARTLLAIILAITLAASPSNSQHALAASPAPKTVFGSSERVISDFAYRGEEAYTISGGYQSFALTHYQAGAIGFSVPITVQIDLLEPGWRIFLPLVALRTAMSVSETTAQPAWGLSTSAVAPAGWRVTFSAASFTDDAGHTHPLPVLGLRLVKDEAAFAPHFVLTLPRQLAVAGIRRLAFTITFVAGP